MTAGGRTGRALYRADPPLTKLHLTVVDRTGWFVGAEDDAEIGHGDVDWAHGLREDAVVEQAAPEPSTTGNVIRRKRSTSSCCSSVWRSRPLPQICSSSPGSFFSARTDVTTSPVTRRAVRGYSPRHVASASLSELETTYFGSELIAVASGSSGRSDQASGRGRCRRFCDPTGTRCVAVELDDKLADGGVAEWGRPAAMGELVAGIFLGSAGRLHHAVEGQERLHGELHVTPRHGFPGRPARRR